MAPSTTAHPPMAASAPALRPRPVGLRPLPASRPEGFLAGAGVAGWSAVVVTALVWGTASVAGAGVSLRAAPVMGHWQWHGGSPVAAALVAGALLVAAGPAWARRAPWPRVPWGAGAAAAGWAAVLAAADGWHRLTEPLTTRHEYEPFAAGVDDLAAFLGGFTEDLSSYPIHVQGHPPGPVVLAWALDRVGLGGAGWLALAVLAGWGVAVAAALVAARAVAGEGAARRAAPALVLLPGAVWAGTSLDALFAGVAAVAAALAVLAVTRRSTRLAAAAGATAGAALLCSYGAVAVLAAPVMAGAVLAATRTADAGDGGGARRRARDAAELAGVAAAGLAAVLALAAAAGFRWPDGLRATGAAYWAGVGARRPAAYLTLVGNPAALALSTGPAVAAGLAVTLARVRTAWRRALLPTAALVAVLAADLSQLSRGEVERIWLPFVPWLALAAPGNHRGWLACQAGVALVLQTALDSPW